MRDSVFFLASKLFGIALQVETWLVFGLLVAVLADLRGRKVLARTSVILSAGLLGIITIFPLGEMLLKPLEQDFPPRAAPEQIDGIIILGGVEDPRATLYWGQPQLNQAAERLTGAAALAFQYPQARVVFSGGSGRLRDIGAGVRDLPPVAIDLLTSLGISAERITWEGRSRNTAENARLSFELIRPEPQEHWLLVTSAFHMGRAIASFEAAGWQGITPYPVDFRTGRIRDGIGWGLAGRLDILNTALKERAGRMVYRITGR